MKVFCLSPLSYPPKINNQKHLSPYFSPAPPHLCSLLLLFFFLPAFSQQTWERTYGGTSDDRGYSIRQTSDSGYIAVGFSNSFGGDQVYLIKINASGDTLWTKTYGSAPSSCGYSVRQTSDGGYIISGSFGGDVCLIKTDVYGDSFWTRIYGGAGNDNGEFVQQTSDGGYIIAGYTDSFGESLQVYLIKTNASGDTLWTKSFGGGGLRFRLFRPADLRPGVHHRRSNKFFRKRLSDIPR